MTPLRTVSWRRLVAQSLVGLLVAQLGLVQSILGAPTAQAADTDIVINEVISNGAPDSVELYNRGSSTVTMTGWTLKDAVGNSLGSVPSSMGPGSFASILDGTLLNNSGDSVILSNGSTTVDSVEYGTTSTAHVPAPDSSKSLARATDGSSTWVSNVTSTLGATNGTPSLPSASTSLIVKAGSTNPSGVINSTSQASTVTTTTFAGTNTGVTVLIGGSITATGTGSFSGSADTTGVSTASLSDGSVSLRGYLEDSSGIRTAWTAGTAATKDTNPPAAPTSLVVRTGDRNGPNVINSHNAGTVVVELQLPGTTNASDGIVVTLTDSVGTSVVKRVAAPQGGGSLLVTGLDVRGLVDGTITLSATISDSNGNTSVATTSTAVGKDTVGAAAPTNLDASQSNGVVTLTWTGSVSADIGSYRIYGDRGTGAVDLGSPIGEVGATATTFTTPSVLPSGSNLLVVRAVDRVGNEENGTSLAVTASGPLSEKTVSATERLFDLVDPLRLRLMVAGSISGTARLTVRNHGTTNPVGGMMPAGSVGIGKFFDLGTGNLSIFPMEVRIYYTQADLDAAGVGSESQLEGIRFYDAATKSWQLYSATGANTMDVTIGSLGFAGYLWAQADHLTPIIGSADLLAPSKPVNFLAEAGDGQVKLSWTATSDAVGYELRYREATNTDTKTYTTLFVSGSSQTNVTIKNLRNGVLYEFGVAAKDAVDNLGRHAVVEQTPTATGPSSDFVIPATATSATKPVPTATLTSLEAGAETEPTTVTEAAPSAIGGQAPTTTEEEPETPPTPEGDGQIKGGTDQPTEGANTRTLVTILIIVIAAAAGFGGYYGYQWWMTKPETTTHDSTPAPEPEPKKKPERNERDGRW